MPPCEKGGESSPISDGGDRPPGRWGKDAESSDEPEEESYTGDSAKEESSESSPTIASSLGGVGEKGAPTASTVNVEKVEGVLDKAQIEEMKKRVCAENEELEEKLTKMEADKKVLETTERNLRLRLKVAEKERQQRELLKVIMDTQQQVYEEEAEVAKVKDKGIAALQAEERGEMEPARKRGPLPPPYPPPTGKVRRCWESSSSGQQPTIRVLQTVAQEERVHGGQRSPKASRKPAKEKLMQPAAQEERVYGRVILKPPESYLKRKEREAAMVPSKARPMEKERQFAAQHDVQEARRNARGRKSSRAERECSRERSKSQRRSMGSYIENVKEDEQMYEDWAVEIKEEMEYGR